MQHILDKAREFEGIREVKGPESNPTIVGWIKGFAKNLKSKLALNTEDTAWCAVFVSMVLNACGYRGTDHALARSYITWGKPSKPVPGCVVVIKHLPGPDSRTGSTGGYHVGFLVQLTKHFIVIYGGNQSNAVRLSQFPRYKYALVAVRMPNEL